MSYTLKLTQSQRAAVDYIGKHRNTGPKVGSGTPCSSYMLQRLKRLGLVMQVGDVILLTYPGERFYTKMHPHSNYRIK